jgi:hypothetical protein
MEGYKVVDLIEKVNALAEIQEILLERIQKNKFGPRRWAAEMLLHHLGDHLSEMVNICHNAVGQDVLQQWEKQTTEDMKQD